MASTSFTSDYKNSFTEPDDATQIRRDIEHTRQEMDETLDELGERLTFHHMADTAMDYVRETSARTTAQAGAKLRSAACQVTDTIKHNPVSAAAVGMGLGTVSAMRNIRLSGDGLRCAADQVTQEVRRHPVPCMLVGAGLLWYAYERSRGTEASRYRYAGSGAPGRYNVTYGGITGRSVPAWHADYDWSCAEEDEAAWTERARAALASIKSSLSDATQTAAEKVRNAASSLVGLCGYSSEHAREKMHRQWAELDERGGSVVDARTGQPYDSSYGSEWRDMRGMQQLAECGERDTSGWSDKASQVVEDLKQTLGSAGGNVRDTLRSMSSKLGEFGSSVGGATSSLGSRAAGGATAAWHSVASGTQRVAQRAKDLGGRAKEYGGRAQESISHGYQVSRDQVAHEIDEHPLATAGAAFGLGLLAGFLVPRTQTEDRYLGEAADSLKDQAWDVAERGKEVVTATGQVAMDQLRDQAKDLAQDALDRGKEVAQATGQAAMHEAQQQGLSPQQMAEQSKAKSGNEGGQQSRGKQDDAMQSACAVSQAGQPHTATAAHDQPKRQEQSRQTK
jgi:ElaB/YqjD/DUF883 family membrane-anchored ribosome-binding protein